MLGSNSIDELIDSEEMEKFTQGFSYSKELSQEQNNQDDSPHESQENQERFEEKTPHRVKNLSDLTFVRLIDPIHIPTYLVEQINNRKYSIQKFYEYQKISCLFCNHLGSHLNPLNFLYAIINEKIKQVKGFLWMTVDVLTNSLNVNEFSIDKSYWNGGEAVDLAFEKAKKVMKDLDLSRIIWNTRTPKFCESRGFKRGKESTMIFELGE